MRRDLLASVLVAALASVAHAGADCVDGNAPAAIVSAAPGAVSWCVGERCFEGDLAAGTVAVAPAAAPDPRPEAGDGARSPDGALQTQGWDLVDKDGKTVRGFDLPRLLHVVIEATPEFCGLDYWGALLVGWCTVKDDKWPTGRRIATLSPRSGKKLHDVGGRARIVVGSSARVAGDVYAFVTIDGRRLLIQDVASGKVEKQVDLAKLVKAANPDGRVATALAVAGGALVVAFGGGAAPGTLIVVNRRDGALVRRLQPAVESCK